MINEVVLVSAVRMAIGRRNGALSGMRADELLAKVLQTVVDRVELDPVHVEDIYCGVVTQVGEQGFILPRIAALTAGFPRGPALTRLLLRHRPGERKTIIFFRGTKFLSPAVAEPNGHCPKPLE